MGTVIFLAAAGIEIALAAFCIATKSAQAKIRSVVRIAALAIFAFFAVLSVIEWGARYYAVTAVLFVPAFMAAVRLLRRREDNKAFRVRRAVLKAAGMTALFFAASIPALVFPQYEPLGTTGKYQVAAAGDTYTDTTRIEVYSADNAYRTLNVAFWYPDAPEDSLSGACPLIVFSHGSLGIKTSNASLYNELASHGYVVCSIDHTYQCLYTTGTNGHTTLIDGGYVRELRAEDAKTNKRQSFEYYKKWMEIRTGDISFVIDRILGESKKHDAAPVFRLIDGGKLGVIGHSLGGAAALGMGRIREDIGAVIALEAPFMYDITGVEGDAFLWNGDGYPVPVLNIYSDAAWSRLGEWPQYAANFALLSDTAPDAYNVYIKGAGHLDLTDLALTSPFLTKVLNGGYSADDSRYCLNTLSRICLEFFDCFLKGKGDFRSEGTY